MLERLKQLISPRLWAVYVPSESLYIPDEAPYNDETVDNICSYYETFDELLKVVNGLQAAGVLCLELYPMWDVIKMLADDEFYIGNGVPDGITRAGFDNR